MIRYLRGSAILFPLKLQGSTVTPLGTANFLLKSNYFPRSYHHWPYIFVGVNEACHCCFCWNALPIAYLLSQPRFVYVYIIHTSERINTFNVSHERIQWQYFASCVISCQKRFCQVAFCNLIINTLIKYNKHCDLSIDWFVLWRYYLIHRRGKIWIHTFPKDIACK